MAEKEERIYVGKLTGNNYTCVIGGVCSGKKCGNCKFGMTRQEAIERMAKGMYKSVWGKMRYSKFDKERFSKLAEAALNALLEADK